MASMADHVRAMLALQRAGSVTFDYGNNIRAQAQSPGVADAFDIPGFVPAFFRPLFCEGKGPFRWAALSGDPADILATDRAILELFPENESLRRWIQMAEARVRFQGLPVRICWLGHGERAKAGLAFNELVDPAPFRPPSSSAATTRAPVPLRPRTAKQRPCATARTQLRTGHS